MYPSCSSSPVYLIIKYWSAENMKATATLARQAILQYLQKTGVAERFPPRSPPQYVGNTVRETIRAWNLDIPEDVCEKYIVVGLDLGYAAYQHTPFDVQITMSLFTFCAVIFDDGLIDAKAMQEFVPRFCIGKPQLHPFLDRFVETALALRRFFPSYTANTICSALLEFANEELYYQSTSDAKAVTLRPGAWQYVEYSRLKSGIPVPYAIGIWPRSICCDVAEYIQAIPDTLFFINYLNDLFSFYKETLEADHGSYINQYVRVHGCGVSEAVENLVTKILSAIENVRVTLGEGNAREAWESFISGYTHFHLYCPRYKLEKIVPEYF